MMTGAVHAPTDVGLAVDGLEHLIASLGEAGADPGVHVGESGADFGESGVNLSESGVDPGESRVDREAQWVAGPRPVA